MRLGCPWWPTPGGPPLPRNAAGCLPDVDFVDGSNGQQDGPLWPTLRRIVGWARADHRHGRSHGIGCNDQRRAGMAHCAASAHRNTASIPRTPHPANKAAIRVAMRLGCPWWPTPGGPPLPRNAAGCLPDVDFVDGSNGQQDGPLWATLRRIVGWARADHRHGRSHGIGRDHHRRAGIAHCAASAHRNTASIPRTPHPANKAAIRVAMRLGCPWWPTPGGPPLPRNAAGCLPDVDFVDGSNGQQDGPLWPTLRQLVQSQR